MLKKLLFCLPFFLSFSFSQPVAAQNLNLPEPEHFFLEDIEVTALTLPENITGKPDRVINTDSGSGRNFTTVSEFLEEIPGLTVRIPGGAGHVASPNLGGLSGNKILVVKDGMPVNDPFTGSPDLGDLQLESYADIEVWRDNRVTLWGSSGLGGVIRLNSRFPESGRLKFHSDGVGGNGYLFETAMETGNASYGIRLGRFSTPGWSAAASERGNTEPDSFEAENLDLAFNSILGNSWQFEARGSYKESMTELDGFDVVTSLPVDSLTFRQKKIEADSSFGFYRADARGEWRISQAFVHRNYTGIDEAAAWNEYGLEVSRHRQAVSRLQRFEAEQTSVVAEISRLETRALNYGQFNVREVESAAVLAIERDLGGRSSLSCSARMDKPDSHKPVYTGHLTWKFAVAGFDLSLGAGSAFRSPSLNERFYPNFGDAALGSEYSNSWQFAIAKDLPRSGRVGFSLVKYNIRDLISTVTTSDPAYAWGIKAANLERAEIKSHEFWLEKLNVLNIDLSAAITILDRSSILSSGKQAPGTPSRRASVTLAKKLAETEIQLQSKWWGHTWENAANSSAAEPGHEMSLQISQQSGPAIISLSLQNLLDEKKERVLGYTRPGRRLLLSSEISF